MTPNSTTTPFLIREPERLREKIAQLPEKWSRRWRHFLDEARQEERSIPWYAGKARDKPLHASFIHLVTGESEFADIARRDFLWMLERHEETLKAGNQDHDTWIYAAVLARRAVSLDWVWNRGVLDVEEQARLVEFFITEALKYPYIVLQHRVPAHASNQGLAMALDCVVTGWLFGLKHGNDARALHLLEFGLSHLLQQIALLPPGGYSGEGSTYIFMVADPLMALACATLEEISGKDWFSREFWPSRNSAANVLGLDPKLIPPSGLLPGWDQHGYHLNKAGAACAYVAHRTGDPAPYYHFLFGPGWEFSGHFAWMRDDHVWQWIWMPDPRHVEKPDAGATCYPSSWAEPRVAGALLDRAADLHLFQMWDVSGARPVRLHMNPNSLLLEAWGSLLTVDGNGTEDFPLKQDPRMQYFHQYSVNPTMQSWADGSIGAHSVICVDGDNGHTAGAGGYENLPGDTPTGFLLRREDSENLQVLSVEAAAFYRNDFDVRSIIRNSALIDNAFWVVLDQIEADSPHDFMWQLVLRAGAVATEYGARLVTPEAVVLDVINLDGCATELHDIAGYPSLLEKRCHHLRKTLRGAAVEFLTVLIPQRGRRELADWTEGWRGAWQSADARSLDPEAELTGMAFEDLSYGPEDQVLWLKRRCAIPESSGRLLLELPRPHRIQLWVDEKPIEISRVEVSKDGEQRLMPAFVEVGEVMAGRTSVELTLRIDPAGVGGVTGGVKLHEALEVATPVVERVSNNELRVQMGSATHTVDLTELRCEAVPLPNPAPEGDDPLEVAADLFQQLSPAGEPNSLEWDGDASSRGRACIDATSRPLAEVEDPLLRYCDDPDWLVRMLAIRALGRLQSHRALPKIIEILHGETPERINHPDYPPKYRLKEICVLALEWIGDPAVAPELAVAMANAGFYGVRRLIPGALERLGDMEAIATLERWSEDADGETANACRRALASMPRVPAV